jgi:hypothetical protein
MMPSFPRNRTHSFTSPPLTGARLATKVGISRNHLTAAVTSLSGGDHDSEARGLYHEWPSLFGDKLGQREPHLSRRPERWGF